MTIRKFAQAQFALEKIRRAVATVRFHANLPPQAGEGKIGQVARHLIARPDEMKVKAEFMA